MAHEIKAEHFFTIPVHELFGYFIDPRLIEKWSAPDGMTLHVPEFDFRVGGRYRYEHFNQAGEKYICTGHFRKIRQNEFIHSVDDRIVDPDGRELASDLQCEIRFTSLEEGSGVSIRSYGFTSEEFAAECSRGWDESFRKLQDILKDSGLRQPLWDTLGSRESSPDL